MEGCDGYFSKPHAGFDAWGIWQARVLVFSTVKDANSPLIGGMNLA